MKNLIRIFLVTCLIFSCNSNDDSTGTLEIETLLIAKGNLYGNGDEDIIQQNFVITDSVTWNALMNQMNAVNNVTDTFSETTIDFSNYQIIAVFDDIKGNGGHILDLGIIKNPENILISITDLVPEGDATSVVTQPFYILKMSKTDLPILFE
jgi:hypothetical protein